MCQSFAPHIQSVGLLLLLLAAVVVVGGCCWLVLVVAGCCWLLLVVVGFCWLVLLLGGGWFLEEVALRILAAGVSQIELMAAQAAKTRDKH